MSLWYNIIHFNLVAGRHATDRGWFSRTKNVTTSHQAAVLQRHRQLGYVSGQAPSNCQVLGLEWLRQVLSSLSELRRSSWSSSAGRRSPSDNWEHHPSPSDQVWNWIIQAERFQAELRARRRGSEEPLKQLYQVICRLLALAYPSVDSSLTTHVAR